MAGIYFLYYNKCLQYIGRSKDIERRLIEHVRKGIKYDIYSVIVCDNDRLEALEKECIKEFKPLLNIRMYESECTRDIVSVDFSGHSGLLAHIKSRSIAMGYRSLSAYIKDVLRVHTEYREEVKEIKV